MPGKLIDINNLERFFANLKVYISKLLLTKQDKFIEMEHSNTDSMYELSPNIFHIWGEMESLTITFADEIDGIVNEYLFQFESGSEPTILTLPNNISWVNNEIPLIEPNYIYQISILKGLASIMKFKKTQ
jgi:hypothetical protein